MKFNHFRSLTIFLLTVTLLVGAPLSAPVWAEDDSSEEDREEAGEEETAIGDSQADEQPAEEQATEDEADQEEESVIGEVKRTDQDKWRETLPEELWYVEESIRDRMALDPNIRPMFDVAKANQKKRRVASKVLFAIGAPITIACAIVWMAPHDLGVDIWTAELVGAVGVSAGAFGLVVPGALIRSIKSKSERDYDKYLKQKYNVIPVVELPRVSLDGKVAWNVLHLRFN